MSRRNPDIFELVGGWFTGTPPEDISERMWELDTPTTHTYKEKDGTMYTISTTVGDDVVRNFWTVVLALLGLLLLPRILMMAGHL